jgi:hypothetical protein
MVIMVVVVVCLEGWFGRKMESSSVYIFEELAFSLSP